MRSLLWGLLGVSCLLGVIFMFSTTQNHSLRASIKVSFPEEFSLFGEWMSQHDKKYENEAEMLMRFGIWYSSHQEIENVNSQKLNYTFGHNAFSDLTQQEWSMMVGNCALTNFDDEELAEPETLPDDFTVPSSVDWVSKGKVNGVQRQGCSDCWVFGGIASSEGEYAIKHGKLEKLSEQQINDCVPRGCNPGQATNVFNYFKTHRPIKLSSYRYAGGRVQRCSTSGTQVSGLRVTGYSKATATLSGLKSSSANHVIAVAINSKPLQLLQYGIYDMNCPGDSRNIDHVVTLVGYSGSYWKIKNSWGTSWGERGYGKLSMTSRNGNKGQCGITTQAYYPKLA